MFNQLDGHDTARFETLLGKDAACLPLAVSGCLLARRAVAFITAMVGVDAFK